jgi:hypothetical protein
VATAGESGLPAPAGTTLSRRQPPTHGRIMDWLAKFPQMNDAQLRDLKKVIDDGFRAFTRTYGDAIEAFFNPLKWFMGQSETFMTQTPWPIIMLLVAAIAWGASRSWRIALSDPDAGAHPTRPLAAARGRPAGLRARLRGGRPGAGRDRQGLSGRGASRMSDFTPSPAQAAAIREIRDWFEDRTAQQKVFRMFGYWAEPTNNPVSGMYSGRMITTAESAAWTWDARPYPAFPAHSDVWTDADNCRLGHWLNGRLGSVSLGSLVRELCRRAGLPDDQIDTSALADVVHGYLISAIESPRASIAPLARQFGFDTVESEGVIRFQPRDRRPVATLGLDELAVGEQSDGEVIELVPRRPSYRSGRGAARHRRGAAGDLRELRARDHRQRRRPPLPPGAARGMGRPRDRIVPASAVTSRL